MKVWITRSWVLLVAVYLSLAVYHSAVNPVCETSDEYWHAGFVVHLARGGGLPVQQSGEQTIWRQEGSQPPLYYWLEAQVAHVLGLPVGNFEQVCPRNPHANLGNATQVGNRNLTLHGPWQAFPWQGSVLTLHVWRFVSVLFGALVVVGTYQFAHTLFPTRPNWALGAGLLVALNPMFLFITGGVTNDALTNALAALTLWHLAHVWRQGLSARDTVIGGLLLGMAALSKLSGLILWPLAAGVYVTAAWRRGRQQPLGGVAIPFALAVLLSGWWYARNWMLYRDPTGLNVMLDIVGRRSATWQDLLGEWEGFRRSFWGVFGGMNVLMPPFFYAFLDAWSAAALIGFLFYVTRRARDRAWGEILVWGGGTAYIAMVFAGLIRWTMQTLASQGRLLFPALPVIALILWAGWDWVTSWVPGKRSRRVLATIPLGVLAVASTAAPAAWIAPVYDPARWTIQSLPSSAERAETTFGGTLRLLGYEAVSEGALFPGDGLDVRLYFEQVNATDQAWSLFVHLVDDVGIILAQEDRYPVQGLLSTRHIRPGTRWEEVMRLQVPLTAVTPATLHLEVGFYNLTTMVRLPVTGQPGLAFDDHVRLGKWQLEPRPAAYPNPTSYVFGEAIELVGFEINPRVARSGDTVRLVLYWRCLRPLDHDYTVFTHVLEPPQTLWGQHDKPPQVPTTHWEPGTVYRETYELTLKPNTPPGFYELEIGWYRSDTGERLRGQDGHTFLFVGRLRVVP